MIDRQHLAAHRKAAAAVARSFILVPIALGVVGWLLAGGSRLLSATESFVSVLYVPFTLIVLAPLVAVPLLRRNWDSRVFSPRTPSSSGQAQGSPAGALATRMIIEYALWEVATLMGFVAVTIGAPLVYLFGATVLTLVGEAYSYPSMSRWEAAADRFEQQGFSGAINA